MNDIVKRLRRWTHAVDAMPASDLMDQAADEIERLRMTSEEVEAVEWCIFQQSVPQKTAVTMRRMLERLK